MVPETYIRKQTLSNAERFVTPELKKYEDTIINSKAKIVGHGILFVLRK